MQQVLEITPVRKAVTVQADAAKAFRVFTEGFDTWWPRGHHIGKSPMTKGVIEGKVGGRCYNEQQDGTNGGLHKISTRVASGRACTDYIVARQYADDFSDSRRQNR